ncbi:EamA family transporter [Candidatus Roizmanbacteria bacterium CG_4_9_14_3_um_filter_33_18]|uniref:EamA family transporter n=1 Tax=Candidatus Roizmanbacteria bacterium CG_4_9_14_3_um_filter_33_18 TaxID=1974841 RepID=A0A2M7XXD8_9BACT|nr:MAG: EamA family transporter [Candidatus Roizmanbacteria bacterium CG_4_9_14_3_um_filter_33_18]
MRKIFNYGPLLIIIAASMWAFDGIIRRSLFTLPSITIVFYEHLFGAVILLPYFIRTFNKEGLTRKEFFLLLFISMFSGVLGTLWFTTALLKTSFISFSVVYLIQKLQPIFAISAAAIVLKEKITKSYIKWAVLALIAAYFVTFKNGYINFATGTGTIIAALYALGAAFAWGSSTAFSKLALIKRPSMYITSLRFLLTAILGLGMVFVFGQSKSLASPTFSQLSRFLLIAVSTGMVSVAIYYRGLKKVQANVSTILELVYPLLAVFIDATLYKSFLAPTQYLAGIVLLFAIYKISKIQLSLK